MRGFILLLFLIPAFHFKTNAQFYFPAEKLAVLDTIYDQLSITRLNEQRLQYISAEYFTVSKYGNQNGMMLIAKEKNYWLVIDLPVDHQYQPDRLKYNGTHFYYETLSSSASRGFIQSTRIFNIIDPLKKIYFEIPSMVNEETWNPDIESDRSVIKSCHCKLSFEQNTITSFQFTNGLSDCLGSGKYQIKNDSIIKFQHYDESNYRMTEVRWAGKIATWMTLNEVKSIYPGASIEKNANRYSICADDERPAYSITENNDTLAIIFLDTEEKHIQKIVALSEKFKFSNIHTGLTAKEVLAFYPKAKIETDLLSEQEYITIPSLNIKAVFNTSEKNRVAKYKNEIMTGLVRPAAKIDYIEIN